MLFAQGGAHDATSVSVRKRPTRDTHDVTNSKHFDFARNSLWFELIFIIQVTVASSYGSFPDVPNNLIPHDPFTVFLILHKIRLARNLELLSSPTHHQLKTEVPDNTPEVRRDANSWYEIPLVALHESSGGLEECCD
jgi:hypothetical protein